MDLDKIIGRRLQSAIRKKHPSSDKKTHTPEQIHMRNIRSAIRLATNGDLDLTKKSHTILFRMAVREGYLDKECNVLKRP